MTDVLSCLNAGPVSRKDILCYIEATQESLLFVVTGRSKATQARLTLNADIFEEYECDTAGGGGGESKGDEGGEGEGEGVRLSLSLTGLLDCLQLFGASDAASASLTYDPADALFRLSLEESGILTTCDLQALYLDEDPSGGGGGGGGGGGANNNAGAEELQLLQTGGLFGAYYDSDEVCAVLLRSQLLREALQELFEASTSSESVRVAVSRSGLSLASAREEDASCEVSISSSTPAPSGGGSKAEVCVSFACDVPPTEPETFEYPIGSLQLAMKALGVAKETFIRVNSEGLMSVQHLVQGRGGHDVFLDFMLMAVA